jgi:hypothetical protein
LQSLPPYPGVYRFTGLRRGLNARAAVPLFIDNDFYKASLRTFL